VIDVKIPDICDFKAVEVIGLLVKPGETIKVDQSLVTVESDKASMDIPAGHAGEMKELRIEVGVELVRLKDNVPNGRIFEVFLVDSPFSFIVRRRRFGNERRDACIVTGPSPPGSMKPGRWTSCTTSSQTGAASG
jgi:hypothetical protein